MKRLLLAFLLIAPAAAAQTSPFTLGGQIRHRSEYSAKDFSGQADPLLFHLLRTRLDVSVQPLPDVRAFVQVQDARFFGGENPQQARGTLDGDADQIDLHQAYLAVSDLFGSPLTLRLGRQELAYGNERLVGALGWSNIGRAFDAALVRVEQERFSADFFAAQLVSQAVHGDADNFYGLYTSWLLAPGHRADVFGFFERNNAELTGGPDAGARRLARATPGVYAYGTAGRLDYGAEVIGQFGNLALSDDAPRQRVRAHLVSGTAGYTVVPEKAVRLALTYTRLSGDSDPADDTTEAFNTLYATNHKFYGFMDYFPALSGAGGLQDAFVSLGGAVSPRLRLALDVHHFATAAGTARTLGQEADVTATFRYNSALGLVLGASAFRPGERLEASVGDDTTFWAYVQTTLTF